MAAEDEARAAMNRVRINHGQFPIPDQWEPRAGDPPAHDNDRDAARHASCLTLDERKTIAAQRLAEWRRTHG